MFVLTLVKHCVPCISPCLRVGVVTVPCQMRFILYFASMSKRPVDFRFHIPRDFGPTLILDPVYCIFAFLSLGVAIAQGLVKFIFYFPTWQNGQYRSVVPSITKFFPDMRANSCLLHIFVLVSGRGSCARSGEFILYFTTMTRRPGASRL